MGGEKARRWLTAVLLVALAHAGAWYGLSHLQQDIVPPRPLTVIEVALLAPPPQPNVTPKQPEPPKFEPKPKIQPRHKPEPRQLLQPQPVAERVMEQAPEPAPVVVAPAPPAHAAETPVRAEPEPAVEAPRFNAAYLNNPPPAYPLSARRRGIEGRVLVKAEVLADGSCNRVELKKTSGFDPLDQAALEAVRKWRFVPARKGSQSISAWVEVPITFKLDN
ncbi:MAG: energy transducer TonB [Sulfuricella denitrificans]|nr:energy transducer TonB [Sulfuricella denitrificans]